MVDVGAKQVTQRVAVAEARVRLPAPVARALRAAVIAPRRARCSTPPSSPACMAAKRTHELIPFCHPLPLDELQHRHRAAPRGRDCIVRCDVSVQHRTGVEMEALTGATVAALTIYDMCKALSHDIEIERVRLLAKTGGKRNVEPQVER